MLRGVPSRVSLLTPDPHERRRARSLSRLRLLTAATACLLLTELMAIPLTSPRFAVRQILVRGDLSVVRLVAPRLGLPANTNLLRAPVGLLGARVREVPAVRRVRVSRRMPNRLVVTIERREAVAVIRKAEEAVLVDPDGVMFAIPDEWGWGLPELAGSGLDQVQVNGPTGKPQALELLTVLRALGPDPQLRVRRLELISAGCVEVLLESGARVRLGRADQLETKIRLLSAALDQLDARRVEYIDLSDPRTAHWRARAPGSQQG